MGVTLKLFDSHQLTFGFIIDIAPGRGRRRLLTSPTARAARWLRRKTSSAGSCMGREWDLRAVLAFF